MRRLLLALALGEALLLTGLYFAWWPLSLIAAGGQVIAAALIAEVGGDE